MYGHQNLNQTTQSFPLFFLHARYPAMERSILEKKCEGVGEKKERNTT